MNADLIAAVIVGMSAGALLMAALDTWLVERHAAKLIARVKEF